MIGLTSKFSKMYNIKEQPIDRNKEIIMQNENNWNMHLKLETHHKSFIYGLSLTDISGAF